MILARRTTLTGLMLMGVAAAAPVLAAEKPAVAVASNMTEPAQEIARLFREQGNGEVRLSFGSSGNFARQIAQGAPFELVMAADEETIERLAAERLTLDRGRLYAIGRLALFVAHGSPVVPDGELRGLGAALAAGKVRRIAMANPEHAPYGRAAQAALARAGLWDRLGDRLVLGENVAQAAQFAATGAAEAGLIAYSAALAPAIAGQGRHALIAEDWHPPLRQRMALLKPAGATAKRFYDFMSGETARAVLQRHGYGVPDDD